MPKKKKDTKNIVTIMGIGFATLFFYPVLLFFMEYSYRNIGFFDKVKLLISENTGYFVMKGFILGAIGLTLLVLFLSSYLEKHVSSDHWKKFFRFFSTGRIIGIVIGLVMVFGFFSPYLRNAVGNINGVIEDLNLNSDVVEALGPNIRTTWGFGVVTSESSSGSSSIEYFGPIKGDLAKGRLNYSMHRFGGSTTTSCGIMIDDQILSIYLTNEE